MGITSGEIESNLDYGWFVCSGRDDNQYQIGAGYGKRNKNKRNIEVRFKDRI